MFMGSTSVFKSIVSMEIGSRGLKASFRAPPRLRKFKRDNPEAITQEEYDRIAEKQEKNNKQLVAEVGSE